MEKHCGNCANRREEINVISNACEMCIQAVLANGERTTPSHWREKPYTNADRIRAMSDEELVQFLLNTLSDETMCSFCVPTMRTENKCDGRCKNGILKWLKQTAEVE